MSVQIASFVEKVRKLHFTNVFNPYSNRCPRWDVDNAPILRLRALTMMLDAAESVEVDSIWVGRDLGYLGGRRTGLALTDDAHFHAHAERWKFSVEKPTIGPLVAERTASIIWKVLDLIDDPIFLWNLFPLHPHLPGQPFSNRVHGRAERESGIDILKDLLNILRPRRVIAIGNEAYAALNSHFAFVHVEKVRHPSYGGSTLFGVQMRQLYGI